MTEWPEDRKNRCLSVSANSAGLHFRERVPKIKENGKKNENRKCKKWAGKAQREKTRDHAHLEQNFKNVIISSNFSLKFLPKVIKINFLPELVYICLKKHYILFAKYNLQSERVVLKHPVFLPLFTSPSGDSSV